MQSTKIELARPRTNSKVVGAIDKILFVFVCLSVGLAPIIYGSTDAIIVLNFEFASFIALGLFGIKLLLDRRGLQFHPLLIPYAIFSLYVFFQLMPILPSTNIPGINTSMLGQGSAWRSISLDPNSTIAALVKLLSLGVYLLLVVNVVSSKERVGILAHVIIIVGFGLAILAVVQDFTWEGKIFWLRETPYHAFGPFVNKDHAAGYFELPFGLGLGMLLGGAIPNDRKIIYGLFSLVTGATIVISRSRGGVVSLVVWAMLVLIISSFWSAGKKSFSSSASRNSLGFAKVALGLVVILGGIFGAGYWVNRDALGYSLRTLGEQQTYQGLGSRQEVWRTTLEIARQSPLFGSGIGAYGISFPRFTRLKGNLTTDYAHNDYLQVLADSGIIGSAIVAVGLIMLLIFSYKQLSQLSGYLKGVYLGAIGGISALLVHSVFDFNLQIFSSALTFIVLIGLCCAIGNNQNWDKNAEFATSQ